MREELLQKLRKIVGEAQVLTEEPMSRHTTFRIGGPAELFVLPGTVEEVTAVLAACRAAEAPYFILGNGSNLLVSDAGYRGVVIQIDHNLSNIQVEGTRIIADGGALLVKLAAAARDAALTGLEFASGIPGTVGGGVTMNAGAYGGEICQVLKEAVVLDEDGEVLTVPVEELELGYRHSRIQDCHWTVLRAVFELEPGDAEAIAGHMAELREKRITKQPLEFPSAGSTFKRPEGYFAGKLIMDAGLRGFRVGDAQVSEKHCGFVINRGHATAEEVVELIHRVQEKIWEEFQIKLETEVRFLGFENDR